MSYAFGAVLLVPFPFTNQQGAKQRPAVVVSSAAYHAARPDIILMPITGQVRSPPGFGEVIVQDWQGAGLLKASSVKPVFFTLERALVRKSLGILSPPDQAALRAAMPLIIG